MGILYLRHLEDERFITSISALRFVLFSVDIFLIIHNLLFVLIKIYLLKTYYTPDTVLGNLEASGNKTDIDLYAIEAYFLLERERE